MQIGRKRVIKLKKLDEPYYLVPLGDVHLGNEACAVRHFREQIAWVHDHPNACWFGMGDYAEFIGYRDSRFDPTVLAKAIPITKLGQLGREFSKQIAEEFRPIADKGLGLLFGNHEDAYQLHQEAQHMHAELCDTLKMQDLGYSCFQEIEFERRGKSASYLVRAHHGAGWAQTDGAVLNKLISFMRHTVADITLVGHLHRRIHTTKVELALRDGRLVDRVKFGAMTGTFLKTYQEGVTTYGEKKGYEPTPLGAYKIPLQPFGEQTIGDSILT